MDQKISREIQNLLGVVQDLVEHDGLDGFEKSLPLFSNSLTDEELEAIRGNLQAQLVALSAGRIPVVTLAKAQDENQSGSLYVHFSSSYVADQTELGWFVDVPEAACWYFNVSDERSSRELAGFFNQADNRRKLESIPADGGVHESSLRLWLLQIRDGGTDILKFGYKSTGQFSRLESEMISLTA